MPDSCSPWKSTSDSYMEDHLDVAGCGRKILRKTSTSSHLQMRSAAIFFLEMEEMSLKRHVRDQMGSAGTCPVCACGKNGGDGGRFSL